MLAIGAELRTNAIAKMTTALVREKMPAMRPMRRA